jgi:hypothetical protein
MKRCLLCDRLLDPVPESKRGPKPTMHPECAEARRWARWAMLRGERLGVPLARLVAP